MDGWAGPMKFKISFTGCRHQLGCFFTQKQVLPKFCSQCVILTSIINTRRGWGRGGVAREKSPCNGLPARPLFNFTHGLGKEVIIGKPANSQNVWTCCWEMWESAGRTPEECTCARTHARPHTQTHHPLFCSFCKGLCLHSDRRQQKGPWYSWSSASKRRGKKWKVIGK